MKIFIQKSHNNKTKVACILKGSPKTLAPSALELPYLNRRNLTMAVRIIPYSLQVSFLMSPRGSSSAIKHVFYYIHTCLQKKKKKKEKKKADVSKTILLDECWLNKAKTNPATDLSWTSGRRSLCSTAHVPCMCSSFSVLAL